jgi:aspartate/methionine/tyrosine aminotransferase
MFSSRTAWDRAKNPLARAVAAARREGGALLDLTESTPTAAGLRAPADVLALLGDPASLAYEPEAAGWPPAREAVAADFARRGAVVAAAHVVLTASTSEAYAHLFRVLCDPGDAVLVPRPSYPLFQFLADLESVEAVPYPLAYDGRWHLRASDVAASLRPRVRAIVVVAPNNPTGSYLKRDEWSDLQDMAAERGLAVISDEVFADYPLGHDPTRVPTLAAGPRPLTFALGGLSKSCGLPQLKLGWMAAGGPDALREEALVRLELVADTFLSVSTPVQRAAPALLSRAAALRAPIAERVAGNLGELRRTLAGSPATVLDVEGGWSAVVQVPKTRGEDEWALDLLARDRVLVHPGYFFDFPKEAYLVLSLLPRAEVFADAVARLRRRVEDPA